MRKSISVLLCAVLIITTICSVMPIAVSANPPTTGNLITDSDFEQYANNTLLGNKADTSLLWQTNANANTWFNAKVTDQNVHSGTKALALYSRYNTAYRSVGGLTPYTDYIFSYYFYLPTITDTDHIKFNFSAVAPTSATLDAYGNITPSLILSSTNEAGTGQWKKQVIVFNSKNNTTVNLYFHFTSDSGAGAAATLILDDLMLYPLSNVMPSFDSNTCGITCDYGLQDGDFLTYKPTIISGNTLRGWYVNGTKFSNTLVQKISQYNASAYTLSVVDNNLISDAGFEGYQSGTNLRLQTDANEWYAATTDGSNWPTITVDNTKSCIGKNSLSLYSPGANTYRKVEGLTKNSLYTLSFDYFLPAYTSSNLAALSFVSLIPGTSAAINSTGNQTGDAIQFLKCTGTAYQGSGSWKNVNLSFDSGENTSVYVSLGYTANAQSNTTMNVDDLSLTAYKGDPVILNGDFEQGNTKQWSKSDSTVALTTVANSGAPAELGNYCGKATSTLDFKTIFSPTINLKANSSYEISMWLKFDSTYPATMILPNGALSDSYADFGIMSGKVVSSYLGANTTVLALKRYDANGVLLTDYPNINQFGSRICICPTTCSGAAWGKWNKFVFTFTAPTYAAASFGVRLNCKGTLYVDGFSVNQLTSSPNDEIKHSITKVGNAIRLTGTQGIRFKNRIDKNALANGFSCSHIVEYGAVAIKKAYLGGAELVLGGSYPYGINSVKKAMSGVAFREGSSNDIDIRAGETKTTIDFSVVLINIAPLDYLENYSVRPYVILQNDLGERTTVYCDTEDSSIFLVAELAYNAKNPDQTFSESATTRSNLYNNILTRANYVSLSVANDTAPLSTTFKGMSSTIYHCYTFMNDALGRNYTDEMAATEMDRMKDCGITTVRSIFKSSFSWSDSKNGWDFSSINMQAVYKWAKMLQDRGIDIALNAGWQMEYIINTTSSIPEVPYLLGNGSDVYGESSGVDFTGMSDYDIRIKKASLRYAEWVKQAMLAFTANGVHNIKYLLVFGEPSGATTDHPEGLCPGEWCEMANALHQSLIKAGIRDQYQLVGPNQGSIATGEGLLNYALAHLAPDVIDIYAVHLYPRTDLIEDPSYAAMCDSAFASYTDVMNRYGCTKDFWNEEFYASSYIDSPLGADSAWAGTQTAVGLAQSMKYGIESLFSWQFSDQLWVNQTNTGGEFVDGYHVTGMEPSLLQSYVPKAQYYATGLTSKYFGGGGGSIYQCSSADNSGLYIGCAKLADGNWTIMVVNAGKNPATFRATLGASLNQTLNRHLFDPSSVNPTAEAKLAGIDATFNVSNTLSDTIPSGGIAIYTTRLD